MARILDRGICQLLLKCLQGQASASLHPFPYGTEMQGTAQTEGCMPVLPFVQVQGHSLTC